MTKDEEGHTISILTNEIWLQILTKLPIKPLNICKCVSKTWCYLILKILSHKKSIHGLVFPLSVKSCEFGDPNLKIHYTYMSLKDGNIRMRIDSNIWNHNGSSSATVEISDSDCDGNLTLDFAGLGEYVKGYHWTIHRGLLLIVPDGRTCQVHNPATKEVFVLPLSPTLEETKRVPSCRTERLATIINLSDSFLTTKCSFRVVRFSKERRLIEVYYSDKREWVISHFKLHKVVHTASWCLKNTVFLEDTLYFLTAKRYAVVVKFGNGSGGEEVCVYCLHLPEPVSEGFHRAVLGGSQGCLYLSYHHFSNLWIWKDSGYSNGTHAWTPQLILNGSEPLTQFEGNMSRVVPIAFDPDSPVVFIYVRPFIFALHLMNDTMETIAKLNEGERLAGHLALLYSPCFGSLECLK